MFTIFGANGNTGKVVADRLLTAGEKVRLAVRDPGKVKALADRGAEVVKVDVEDAKSVATAIVGATGVYFLMPPDLTTNDLVARNKTVADNLVAALREHPVKHVVLLSSVGAQHAAGTGPIKTVHYAEKAFGALSGTTFTFLRAAYFMENFLGYAHPMRADGLLPVFGGGEAYKFPMVATHDIGEVAAKALLAPPAANEVIELSGPEPYSFEDAAAIATRIFARPVSAKALPIEGLVPAMTGLGMSADMAGQFKEMTEGLGKGLVAFEGKGRSVKGTVTLEQVLRAGLAVA